MPMSRDEKFEKVQRLLTAHSKTKELLENAPVTWEVHPGTDIARNWTVITAAYSGLEQTMKYLIAEENAQSIAELIKFRDGKNLPYQTHDLLKLFSKLAEPTQDVVRDFYGRFQSLHSYISEETVGKFLSVVSEADGRGYERWRYTLIEDRPLPRNSPEALVALWGVCVQIARERAWEKPRVRMPNEALSWEFCNQLETLEQNVSIDRQNAGEPFQDIAGETREWLWRTRHPLNAFADVLWHFSRFGEHGQADVSKWFSDALTRWAQIVLKNPAIAGATSLRAFVKRAQGQTPDGRSIRWDRNANRFEDVPWSLENRHQAALAPDAVVIGDPTGMRLRMLWQAAKGSGYRVLENRSFKGPANEDRWFCTVEVQTAADGDERPILSIWEKRNNDEFEFYMVEQCSFEAIDADMRTWIEMVALKAQPKASWGA